MDLISSLAKLPRPLGVGEANGFHSGFLSRVGHQIPSLEWVTFSVPLLWSGWPLGGQCQEAGQVLRPGAGGWSGLKPQACWGSVNVGDLARQAGVRQRHLRDPEGELGAVLPSCLAGVKSPLSGPLPFGRGATSYRAPWT